MATVTGRVLALPVPSLDKRDGSVMSKKPVQARFSSIKRENAILREATDLLFAVENEAFAEDNGLQQ